MRKFAKMAFVLLVLASLVSMGWWARNRQQKSVQFDRAFTSYCMNAVRARTVEESIVEMEKAVKFLEDHNLTAGSTSVLYYESDEDIGVFYQRMKQSRSILQSMWNAQADPYATKYTFSALMIGEDHLNDASVSKIKGLPAGISIYPHNTAYVLWFWASLIGLIVGIVGAVKFHLSKERFSNLTVDSFDPNPDEKVDDTEEAGKDEDPQEAQHD